MYIESLFIIYDKFVPIINSINHSYMYMPSYNRRLELLVSDVFNII